MKKDRNELLLHSVKQGLQENMSSGTYTCTMHPEIISDKPGKCPKCGMTLVKKNELYRATAKLKYRKQCN